jgi:hypothetical protein
VSGNQLTLSVPCTQTRTTTNVEYYLPVSDQTWSAPTNSSFSNYGGKRVTIQYSGDNTRYGSYIDTMFDMRNNIFYWTTGIQGVYDRTRFKRSNNIYSPIGSVRYSSSLGGTLKTGEKIITTKIFADTTALYPENWDLHLVDTSYGIGHGLPTPGFDKDFDGNLIGNVPSIGLYQQYNTTSIPCIFTYGVWSPCNNSIQTRTYSTSPIVCYGFPPTDSIRRACVVTNTNLKYFYYNSSYVSLRIDSSIPGLCRIQNPLGQIITTISYSTGARWYSVATLPSGIYVASTQGKVIRFTR